MPKTEVIFFREKNGDSPVVDWLTELQRTNQKAWANCRAKIELLAEFWVHEQEDLLPDF